MWLVWLRFPLHKQQEARLRPAGQIFQVMTKRATPQRRRQVCHSAPKRPTYLGLHQNTEHPQKAPSLLCSIPPASTNPFQLPQWTACYPRPELPSPGIVASKPTRFQLPPTLTLPTKVFEGRRTSCIQGLSRAHTTCASPTNILSQHIYKTHGSSRTPFTREKLQHRGKLCECKRQAGSCT